MAFEIDIKQELHLPQLEDCPSAVQQDLRESFKNLKSTSAKHIRNNDLDFIEHANGQAEYNIVSTVAAEDYIVTFEIEENSDSRNTLRILRIGKKSNMLD